MEAKCQSALGELDKFRADGANPELPQRRLVELIKEATVLITVGGVESGPYILLVYIYSFIYTLYV